MHTHMSNLCIKTTIGTSQSDRNIDREPEGGSLAEKLTNFLLYSGHLCI